MNALGCVYVDIDRRYFNNNAGLGFGANYAVINVKPGYQKMCGQRALEYVRYRHTDNDIVRGARQQDFLRQVRSQVNARELFDNVDKLIDIFADNTALGHPVHRRPAPPPAGDARRAEQADQAGQVPRAAGRVLRDREPGADQGRHAPVPLPAPGQGPAEQEPQALQDRAQGTASGGQGEPRRRHRRRAAGRARSPRTDVGFPVYYPRKLVHGLLVRRGRAAHLHDHGHQQEALPRLQDGVLHRLHRRVLRPAGHLAGATRRSSSTPPRRARSEAASTCSSTTATGCAWSAWKTDRGSYWISNTLLQTLSAKEMLGVARSLRQGALVRLPASAADNVRACLRGLRSE